MKNQEKGLQDWKPNDAQMQKYNQIRKKLQNGKEALSAAWGIILSATTGPCVCDVCSVKLLL